LTSLASYQIVFDFSQSDTIWQAEGTKIPDRFAFGVFPNLNHGTIVDAASDAQSQLFSIIKKTLLADTPEKFVQIMKETEQITDETYKLKDQQPPFQQLVFHAIDDFGESIQDFTVDFFLQPKTVEASKGKGIKSALKEEKLQDWSQQIHDEMQKHMVRHSKDRSFMRILIHLRKVLEIFNQAKEDLKYPIVMCMRIFAAPVEKGIKYMVDGIQDVVIYDPTNSSTTVTQFLHRNTTTLVEIRIDRYNNYVKIKN